MVEYETCIVGMEALPKIGGKRGRGIQRFDLSYSSSPKIVEGEGRTLKALFAIFRGFDQNL